MIQANSSDTATFWCHSKLGNDTTSSPNCSQSNYTGTIWKPTLFYALHFFLLSVVSLNDSFGQLAHNLLPKYQLYPIIDINYSCNMCIQYFPWRRRKLFFPSKHTKRKHSCLHARALINSLVQPPAAPPGPVRATAHQLGPKTPVALWRAPGPHWAGASGPTTGPGDTWWPLDGAITPGATGPDSQWWGEGIRGFRQALLAAKEIQRNITLY